LATNLTARSSIFAVAFDENIEGLSVKRKAETFVIYPPPDDKPEYVLRFSFP
jgi:hypothetical protein